MKKFDKKSKLNNQQDNGLLLAKAGIQKQAGMAILSVVVIFVLIFAMSVAWYSNVIHTENLTFETASWDFTFEGQVVIDTTQKAAPGRSGVVDLKLSNEGDEAIDVIVNVSRDLFSEELKKRIYFYVDDAQVETFTEGETTRQEVLNRVYVNEMDEYTYTVLGKNALILNEEYANAPLLKWEWVYDVLGYYVQGTITDSSTTIEEYLRPISYDYEAATFTDPLNDEDINNDAEEASLLTVDGETTVEQFLAQLSETDGYQSAIDSSRQVNGYYPVSVDANGKGIWVYLCNKSEILMANQWDTYIGEQVAAGQTEGLGEFVARLLLTGQQREERTEVVYDVASISNCLADESIDKIQLGGDMHINQPLTVPSGRTVTLDLNEYTLLTPDSGTALEVQKGGELIVANGTISCNNEKNTATAITSYGGSVTLNGVTMQNVYEGLSIDDDAAATAGADSTVIIESSNLTTADVTVMLRGNGTVSARRTTLIINDSTLVSEGYIAIMGNGSAGTGGAWGTNIMISGSTINGYWASIYHPQRMSTLDITDSTLSGYTALAIKGGIVNVDGSTVLGTGAKQDAAFAVSGFTDTGDAIYVETNYETEIQVNVSGESYIRSDNGYAIQVYQPEAVYATVLTIGGYYSSDVSGYLPADGSFTCQQTSDQKYPYYVGATPVSN